MTNRDLPTGNSNQRSHEPDSYAFAYFRAMLQRAWERELTTDPRTALDALFAFDAAYLLGRWLSTSVHHRLLRRLGEALPDLGGLQVPHDPELTVVLAQHVRELERELGPQPWLQPLVLATQSAMPVAEEDWDSALRAGAAELRRSGDHRPLTVAHARRRLWELEHGAPTPPRGSSLPLLAFRSLVREAVHGDGYRVQAVQVAARELLLRPYLAADLLAALLPRR